VSVYSATKAALDGFSRSLARELGPKGIRVNSVAPGFFESDMAEAFSEGQLQRIIRRTPLKRLGTVDDIVGVIRFLISPSAGFITGQTIVVDGGLSC
jgi:3-oxoacyl-[acyl-carrier protein] reductase